MKPLPKYKKCEDQGRQACRDGKKLTDNPYRTYPDIALASWWDAGWNKEQADK